jgi:hypothetical protein
MAGRGEEQRVKCDERQAAKARFIVNLRHGQCGQAAAAGAEMRTSERSAFRLRRRVRCRPLRPSFFVLDCRQRVRPTRAVDARICSPRKGLTPQSLRATPGAARSC